MSPPRFPVVMVLLAIGCLPVLSYSGSALAADAQDKSPAAALVRKAVLQPEASGADRQRLLQAALAASPGYGPARWHSGYIKRGAVWCKFDEAATIEQKNTDRNKYRRIRGDYADAVPGQLALARWCDKHGLEAEARAHLTRVLDLNPDHAEARALLGFRRVNNLWMSREEIAAARGRATQAVAALKEWRPRIKKLRAELSSRSKRTREEAAEKTRAIDDPAAIPVLELMLSQHNESSAQLVVETVGAMSAYEAAHSLARHAIFSPWVFVRHQAFLRLKKRSFDDYVPEMLGAMYTPIQSRAELLRGPRGRLLYRHAFYREGQQQRELAVFDTQFERIALPGGDRRESLGRAVGRAARAARAREAASALQNQRATELNRRICQLLAVATEQDLPDEPLAWWNWWTEYNEVYVSGRKPLESTYRRDRVAVVDTPRITGGGGTMDCLAAGTKVWALSGPMPIEKIARGDQVLAQDPTTGELAYKPVLRTTVRPASTLVHITSSRGTIRTSGGHLFWRSGEGWSKARDVKPAARLHAVQGTVEVLSATRGEREPTYNLVVADFHSYFVGPDMILSHDNTVRESTNAIVPGFTGQ